VEERVEKMFAECTFTPQINKQEGNHKSPNSDEDKPRNATEFFND